MPSQQPEIVPGAGVNILYEVITVLCQTLFYGVYAVLLPFSVYIIRKRGQSQRFNRLLYCTLFMFLLSSAGWASSVATIVLQIHALLLAPSQSLRDQISAYSPLASAVVLINYVITDGVVVWRAWVLCWEDSGRLLYAPLVFLGFTSISVSATIVIRVAIMIIRARGHIGPEPPNLTNAINVTQMANLVLTLLTNIMATALIARKAWWVLNSLRRDRLTYAQETSTPAESVLALVVESGVLYCLSTITVLVSSLIVLPFGTLGDIYTPVNVQIAGIYPTVVLLIVSLNMTVQDATANGAYVDSGLEFSPGGPAQSFTQAPLSAGRSDRTPSRDRHLGNLVPRLKTIVRTHEFMSFLIVSDNDIERG
ncbi:hypothetical protein AURDEDRAFT_51722 [Auricularia subglabra TFB-10046 SS5]|nr:hypothetical protein AURDEDRAFT_51722 [Auricularia subglabra TFB-10046 SS5]